MKCISVIVQFIFSTENMILTFVFIFKVKTRQQITNFYLALLCCWFHTSFQTSTHFSYPTANWSLGMKQIAVMVLPET